MRFGSRRRARREIGQSHRSMRRHEHLLRPQDLAAGAAQAKDMPVIHPPQPLHRDQKIACGASPIRLFRQRPQDGPMRMQAAGGKRKIAGEQISAGLPPREIARGEGGGGDRIRVLPPDVLLRLEGEAADHPLVFAQHGVDPAARGAGARQFFHDAGEGAETVLRATECARLQHAQNTGGLESGDGCGGNLALRRRFRCTPRQQRAGAGQEFIGGGLRVVHKPVPIGVWWSDPDACYPSVG